MVLPLLFYGASYLDKREFAEANTAFGISNGHFAVMLDPSSPTEDVVDTRGDFIPHVVISIPTEDTALIKAVDTDGLQFLQVRITFG